MAEPTPPAADAPDECESCGSPDELAAVRRLYVTPEAWDTPGSVRAGDVEWWCAVCRTHYPHADPAEPTPDG